MRQHEYGLDAASLEVVIHDRGSGFCIGIYQVKASLSYGKVTPVAKMQRLGDAPLLATGYRHTPGRPGRERGSLHPSCRDLEQSPTGYRSRPSQLPIQGLSRPRPAEDHVPSRGRIHPSLSPPRLPLRFHRIRYYGFQGNCCKKEKLNHCRQLLGMPLPQLPPESSEVQDYRERCEELNGISLRVCPVCRRGHMVLIDTLAASRRPAIKDTS